MAIDVHATLGGDRVVTEKPQEGSVPPTGCRERGQSPGFTLVTEGGCWLCCLLGPASKVPSLATTCPLRSLPVIAASCIPASRTAWSPVWT